jgi:LL-diaminopimelate aminotransferase
MSTAFLKAARLRALPPFLFNQVDEKKRAALAAGKDVINLGVGDPDRPTPGFVVEAMEAAVRRPENHQYPDCYGTKAFLASAARFMQRRFGVKVDAARHLVALIGSKDGISHLPMGVLDPGDGAVVFAPAYPVYAAGTVLAGGVMHRVETTAAEEWLPNLGRLTGAAERAKLLWLNFPGNPTGAVAPLGLFADALKWCAARGAVCASDLAYSEVYFEGPVPSLWQAPGADIERTRAIEFHSLSKTFNMTGWRIGFAVGHEDVVGALKQVKDNYDSGPFNAVQAAGAEALDRFDDAEVAGMREVYKARRDVVVEGLKGLGCAVTAPKAGVFVWSPCPVDKGTGRPMDSWKFVGRLIDEAAVVTVPGAGFAESATGMVRVSLTRETGRIREAMERLAAMAW